MVAYLPRRNEGAQVKEPPPPDDWRRQGQEEYLRGVRLLHMAYVPYRPGWEHDHCEFCYARLSQSEGDLQVGYTTTDHYRWICEDCFADFCDEFEWKVQEG